LAVQIDHLKNNYSADCLPVPAERKVFLDLIVFGHFQISDSSTPTMGKQSQIIIFRVVSGQPDLEYA
jgi:hypothetical protein